MGIHNFVFTGMVPLFAWNVTSFKSLKWHFKSKAGANYYFTTGTQIYPMGHQTDLFVKVEKRLHKNISLLLVY